MTQREQQLQEQVDALQQQLANVEKLTALGELVGTTTHEFNNALMSIINYAKMGMRHRDDATRDKAFERILSAGNRASKVTNSVLAMARNRSDSQEPTDLPAVINEVLVLLERELAKYRIAVETQFADVPRIRCNANQIQQVLLNLLLNARQAIGESGNIAITLKEDKEQGTVDLSVRDSGAGIPADKIRKIFEPFYTTKNGPDQTGRGGTGLGLAACRNIIEAHRGRIRVESKVGRGTCFTIKLPLAAPPATPAPVVATPAAATMPSSATT